ncbi:MAG TPA: polysaccharide biosynthesis/export family protein [Pyrinomonadaceae bacterium]|jgi:protein involved in polysaccharide export with SLBB domain
MKVKALILFVAAICLFQTAFGQETRGYLLGPGDVVEGKVLGEEQFNFVSTVDEDGKIQVPFFDEGVAAKCKTEKDLRTDVAKLLSKYLKNPQISVRVTERKSRPPAVVSGEVINPLQFVLNRKATLLELINFAGGLKKASASGMIEVFHTQPPVCTASAEEEAFWKSEMTASRDVPSKLYSYNSIKQGSGQANPEIYPGDLIVARVAPPVYVIGEVMSLKEITIPETGLSLMQAIAQAGGFSREARKKEIVIQRFNVKSPDKRDFIKVNYELIKNGKEKDVMLQPEDIVVVDKTKKSVAQTILEIATGSVKNFTNVLPQRVLY